MDVLIVIGLLATTGMACVQWRLWRRVEQLARQRQELLVAMNRLERLAEEFQDVGRQTVPPTERETWPQREDKTEDSLPGAALSREFTLPDSWSQPNS